MTTTSSEPMDDSQGILAPSYLATTIGMFSLIAFIAFEAMAVTTVMPTVARDLDGLGLYALAFAAPLASGVIGMVAAGIGSDRRGPALPLMVSTVLFAAGLLVCGTAPTMEILAAGRVLQGLGGGALTVSLYVVVGMSYPAKLQPSIFASFAAAWVLPSLFGPAAAAFIASELGWRWVFLLVVLLVGAAALLIVPTLRRLRAEQGEDNGDVVPVSRLVWAVVAAVAVLAVELLGSRRGASAALAVLAGVVVVVAVRRLVPRGTLRLARGLPAVIGTRGGIAAGFFCAEAYIAYVLQDRWGWTPGHAGIALTVVGVVWALGSQVQARIGERMSNERVMVVGTLLVVAGIVSLWATVWLDAPGAVAVAAYGLSGAGMGFGYPRTGVAMLAASTDQDRGANSSALSIADSLGAALALSISGVAFAAAERSGLDPFLAVFAVGIACAVLGLGAARRTTSA